MNTEPEHELRSAEVRWSAQLKLLQQISYRLLAEPYDEVYEWDVKKAQQCLIEMQKLVDDLPKHEPVGPSYDHAKHGMRECLTTLEESLKLLVEAKKTVFASAMNSGWERVLEQSSRR